MSQLNIFCFGFGQVAKSFIKKIKDENIKFKLSVTSREESKIKTFEGVSYQSFKFNEEKFDNNLLKNLKESDYILVSIAPINNKDIVIENFKQELITKNYKWITYLSATSVYGNHNGEWVDEESETKPTSTNGIQRLNVENNWLSLVKENNLSLQIFRLSGIYSDQYNILTRLKLGQAKLVKIKNHFFSRIHVEDIANVLFKSLKNFKKGEIYNISDDLPESNEKVIEYGLKLLKIKRPEMIEIKDIENEMLRNFYKDSKKVKNKKMKVFFKLKLKYPTYIEGLNHINNNFI